MLAKMLLSLIRGRWGAILPALFKSIAEGDAGPQAKAVYWWAAKYKTVTGAALMAIGAGLETVCAAYPEYTWACPASRYVYMAGSVLALVGLVDGGTRAPWPAGTEIPPGDKR